MSSLDVSLLIIYFLCWIPRMWSLRAAWTSPLFHGERYFLDVPVAEGFYRGQGKSLLLGYRILLAAPYAAELGCFLFLLIAGRLGYLIPLMLAGGVACVVATLAAVRLARRTASRFAVRAHEAASPGLALPLEERRLAAYTNPAVEAALAFGNVVSLVLLALWSRGPGIDVWHTFRLPLLLIYAQLGFVLIKHALVRWRTALPLAQAESYLEYREETRRWFIEICDWLRAHSVAFLASYTAIVILGPVQNDLRVRWAVLLPWTALAVAMAARLISTAERLRATGSRLKPLPAAQAVPRATRHLYYNPDDPALFVRGPRWFTINFADRRVLLYTSYVIGLVAIVTAGALR